jgi:hypothetical protein
VKISSIFVVFLENMNFIIFEPEFGNQGFETQEKNPACFNFQLTSFPAIIDFILWFCTSLSSETLEF